VRKAQGVGAHLVAGLCVQENPAKLYHLRRIFGNVNSMLIAGGSNMNNDVSVEIALLALASGRHLECIFEMFGRRGGF
jgi:hypothetical protein